LIIENLNFYYNSSILTYFNGILIIFWTGPALYPQFDQFLTPEGSRSIITPSTYLALDFRLLP
jgi:hypothetical protein